MKRFDEGCQNYILVPKSVYLRDEDRSGHCDSVKESQNRVLKKYSRAAGERSHVKNVEDIVPCKRVVTNRLFSYALTCSG